MKKQLILLSVHYDNTRGGVDYNPHYHSSKDSFINDTLLLLVYGDNAGSSTSTYRYPFVSFLEL